MVERSGWEHNAAVAVGLRLTTDNRVVEAARIVLLGCWTQPVRAQASHIFMCADPEIYLELAIGDLGMFRC